MKNYSRAKKIIKAYGYWSHILSFAMHPILMPTYIILLLGYFSPISISPLNSEEGRTFLFGLIFLSTFILPLLLVLLIVMIKNKEWTMQNFYMSEKKDRVFPFFIIGLYYSILIYFIKVSPLLNSLIVLIMSCITLSILLIALISNFYKISAHSVGIAGALGILTVVNNKAPDATLFYPIIVIIFLTGCLLSARLFLKAHSPIQVALGFALGLTIGISTYLFI